MQYETIISATKPGGNNEKQTLLIQEKTLNQS